MTDKAPPKLPPRALSSDRSMSPAPGMSPPSATSVLSGGGPGTPSSKTVPSSPLPQRPMAATIAGEPRALSPKAGAGMSGKFPPAKDGSASPATPASGAVPSSPSVSPQPTPTATATAAASPSASPSPSSPSPSSPRPTHRTASTGGGSAASIASLVTLSQKGELPPMPRLDLAANAANVRSHPGHGGLAIGGPATLGSHHGHSSGSLGGGGGGGGMHIKHTDTMYAGSMVGGLTGKLMSSSERATADGQDKFLTASFPLCDALLQSLYNMNPAHKLAPLLLESVLFTREVLNCWEHGELTDIALESLGARRGHMASVLKRAAEKMPIKIEGTLDVSSTLGWTTCTVQVRLYNVLKTQKSGAESLFDLRNIVQVQDVHTGKDPEFRVVVCDYGFAGLGRSKLQTHHFRAQNDATKQQFMTLFHAYRERNLTEDVVSRVSVTDQVDLYAHTIHRPYLPAYLRADEPTSPGGASDSNANTNATRKHDKRQEFLFASTDLTVRDINVLEDKSSSDTKAAEQAQASVFGLVERFRAKIKQTMGKDKPREIEIDLSPPHYLRIYNPKYKTPENVYGRRDLIDYKEEDRGKAVEICFKDREKPGRVHRRFTFESELQALRFQELLLLFQSPPDDERVELRHEEICRVLVHTHSTMPDSSIDVQHPAFVDESESKSGGKKVHTDNEGNIVGRVFKIQLHSLIGAMAQSARGNKHVVDLLDKSKLLPLTIHGDAERLKLLCRKLYAVDEGGKVDQLQCQCGKAGNGCLLQLYRAFHSLQGLNDLRRMLHSSEMDAQKYALRLVWQAFQVKPFLHKCEGPVQLPQESSAGMVELRKLGGGDWSPARFPVAWYVGQAAVRRPLNEELVDVLFEFLLNDPRPVERETSSSSAAVERINVMNKNIVEKRFLPALMHGLTKASPSAQELALKNFALLLDAPENCDVFLEGNGWQAWIFPLFLEGAAKKGNVIDTGANVYKLAQNMFSSLHYQWMSTHDPRTERRDDRGERKTTDAVHPPSQAENSVLWSTMQYFKSFAVWNKATIPIMRMFIFSLLSKLSSRARIFTNNFDWNGGQMHNVFTLLHVVEEFLFFTPIDPTGSERMRNRSEFTTDTTVEGGLHLENRALADYDIMEKIAELLVSLQLSKYDPDMPVQNENERMHRQRGAQEYAFYTQLIKILQPVAHPENKDGGGGSPAMSPTAGSSPALAPSALTVGSGGTADAGFFAFLNTTNAIEQVAALETARCQAGQCLSYRKGKTVLLPTPKE